VHCYGSRRDFALSIWPSGAPGRWVALDDDDVVRCDAETLGDLHALLDSQGIEDVEVVRAPVPGEPVVFGLG
jgi:hypothetical protein